MEEAFIALLWAADLGLPDARINFGTHPQGAKLPGIVLTVVDSAQGLTLGGPDKLWAGRVQVDCYAEQFDTAKLLSRKVIAALDGHADDAFQGIFLIATRDSHETSAPGRPFRTSLDFSTHWSAHHG